MPLKLITAAAGPVLDRDTVKAHLRVDHADDDTLIDLYRDAVTANLDGRDGWLGRALITQTWELTLDRFPCREIKLPLPPLVSVTSVKYDDTSGVEQTVAAADYDVDTVSAPGWVVPLDTVSWPDTLCAVNAVRVRYVAGYGATPAFVPASIRAAMLLMIGDLYANRELRLASDTIENKAAKYLLAPYQASFF